MRDALQQRKQEAAMWRNTVCPPREKMAMRADLAAGAYCCELQDYPQAFDLFVGVYEHHTGEDSVRCLALCNITTFFDRVGKTINPKREWGAPPSAADIVEMRRILAE